MTSLSTDKSALLNGNQPWYMNSTKLYVNFIVMTLCFSVNHGTITAVLGLATSLLKAGGETKEEKDRLRNLVANTSSGCLYVMYTLTALTFAAGLVQYTGCKKALNLSLFFYCFYVASFWIASTINGNEYPEWIFAITICGSVLGGMAAGWLWTAQGAFFSRTAGWYARAKNIPVTEASSKLSGIFAMCYVGFEVILKLLSSTLYTAFNNSSVALFSIYTITAIVAAALSLFIIEPPAVPAEGEEEEDKDKPKQKISLSRKFFLAMNLLASNRKMQCLVLLNCAFGVTGGVLNGFINGNVTKNIVGAENLGYFLSMTPAVATVLSVPYSTFANYFGKAPLMFFGSLCFALVSGLIWIMSFEKLTDLGYGICVLYILMGSGRAVFENTNKALVADFFPADAEAAFANVIFQSGAASAVTFFIIAFAEPANVTDANKNALAGPSCIIAVVSGLFLMLAFCIKRREDKEDALLQDIPDGFY